MNFEKSLFKETASFIRAKFLGKTSFYHTEFRSISLFCIAKFKDDAVFIETKFNGCAQFEGIQTSKLLFENCKILSCIEFKGNDPSDTLKIHALSLKDTQVSGRIDLDWENDNLYNLLKTGNSNKTDLIKQLAVLKEIYHSQGDYKTEDDIYVTLMNEKKALHRDSNCVHKYLAFTFIKLISTYGTHPFRILVTSLLSIGIFGVAYYACASMTFSNVSLWDILIYTLHGFVSPIRGEGTAIAIISSIECIWGLLMIAFFSATIIRKTIR